MESTRRSAFSCSPTLLVVLAAFVWYAGGIALLLKGRALLIEADEIRAGVIWTWSAIPAGMLLGALKARYIFVRSLRKNLARITALQRPMIWQFYRPGFFLALAIMIATGATLSRLAHGSYPFLISVATLDFALSTALLASSLIYWRR